MRLLTIIVSMLLWYETVLGQEAYRVQGSLKTRSSDRVVAQARITLENTMISTVSDHEGNFTLTVGGKGEYVLLIEAPDYLDKRLPVHIGEGSVDLGVLVLEPDIQTEQADNLITLTDSEVVDDGADTNPSGLLQATRDVFLNRAAFDFGQAFFRVRGYDSRNGRVSINGFPMNKFIDGRPQWNNWGGLNDITRNQQFSNGLAASDFTFGGILGNTNIDTRPSGLRPGTRLSASVSNRTYSGRLMATHNSSTENKGLAYTLSASRRWAEQGYIEGTLYDAYSLYGAIEYGLSERHSLNLTGIFASNRRGRSSAITEEVFELAGKRYNPYWGHQDGDIRNARERLIEEPIFMFNHRFESPKFSLNTGLAYQFGIHAKSRLGYYNAPNPDPTYYRYLPSYYINSPIGANFRSANLAKEGFLAAPQIDWAKVYTANGNGEAAYLLYDDTVDDEQLTLNTIGNANLGKRFQFDFGLTYRKLTSHNYAKINDLLGAESYVDIDPFSYTLNDVDGALHKGETQVFNYNYVIRASQLEGFGQIRYSSGPWSTFLSAKYSSTQYQREGLFRNERFMSNSLGESAQVGFDDYGFKSGLTYRISGRHWVDLHGAFLNRPPVLQNVFINPRENNAVVPDVESETVSSVDLNYNFRLPDFTGRISGFYSRFQNTTDINFFFVDAGIGSDFVQEVLTDLDKLHMGMEIGMEYRPSSAVKLSAVAAIGKYLYASNPSLSINFDTSGREEDLINLEGNVDLGASQIKDYRLPQGPQQAYALGIEYRDPNYWWVGATTNYLADNHVGISAITRTASFYLDPETGRPFPEATTENAEKLLKQESLDNFYLLNLVGGKSWLKNGKYISIFVSINNLFDAVFRTGGYEQARNGNFGQLQEDNMSGTPSFAPKYWYGYGRTYFLNLAFSF
ncbi:peptidase associated domain and porin domain-containing protein [Pseudozobellia thermophila]|uniref:CarboxypepD_reg-like domain-containing protein n=1 Tax=Pseudozobellia thermophila TaxID=192903 RepID=A0A1M6ATN8_9FLAO|nr:TonB-dependent receptor plug domain-containing protein [Pseudozobellia thermophila]SHI39678.1 CarboxypepD_reg-like domain-containing protein [Pseudozobellia thermophila]